MQNALRRDTGRKLAALPIPAQRVSNFTKILGFACVHADLVGRRMIGNGLIDS